MSTFVDNRTQPLMSTSVDISTKRVNILNKTALLLDIYDRNNMKNHKHRISMFLLFVFYVSVVLLDCAFETTSEFAESLLEHMAHSHFPATKQCHSDVIY